MKERLRELLEKLGYTATKLADEIDVQRSGISHILSGRNQPSFDFLVSLLNRFPQIEARWLLLGEGPMFVNTDIKDVNSDYSKRKGTENVIEQAVRNEDPVNYKVTNVTTGNKLIFLHADGTFEVYNQRERH